MSKRNKTKNNFDSVAWFYDFLSSIVFGNKLRQSQIILFTNIKDNDRVLILGGGTGWVISELLKVKKVKQIDFIESSEKMLAKAKSLPPLHNDVVINYIHGNEQSIHETEQYDIILAGYFFDIFQQQRLESIILKLRKALKAEGKLLVSDFHLDSSSLLKHKALVKIMYLFFNITCRLEINELIDFRNILEHYDFKLQESFSFEKGLILSEVYRK